MTKYSDHYIAELKLCLVFVLVLRSSLYPLFEDWRSLYHRTLRVALWNSYYFSQFNPSYNNVAELLLWG